MTVENFLMFLITVIIVCLCFYFMYFLGVFFYWLNLYTSKYTELTHKERKDKLRLSIFLSKIGIGK